MLARWLYEVGGKVAGIWPACPFCVVYSLRHTSTPALDLTGATSQVAGSPAILDQTVVVLDRTVNVLNRTAIYGVLSFLSVWRWVRPYLVTSR